MLITGNFFICSKCICCHLIEKNDEFILQMSGRRNEVLDFINIYINIQIFMRLPQSKVIKTGKKAQIDIFHQKKWANKICSGATVFHNGFKCNPNRQEKKRNIFSVFFLWKIKMGFMYTRNVCDAVLCVLSCGSFHHTDIHLKFCSAAVDVSHTHHCRTHLVQKSHLSAMCCNDAVSKRHINTYAS